MNRQIINFVGLSMFLFAIGNTTATARILTSDEVSLADTQALIAEADVFKAIGMGIALSIANCAGVEECIPSVDQEELKRLLDALDKRISHLQDKVESEEVSEEELGNILTAYVDERENYLRYLDQLGTITPAISEEVEVEDTFSEDIFSDVDEEVEDYSVFEDSEEEIIDDIDPEAEEISEEL